MSREDVEEAIIKNMLAVYMPGQHIRGDKEAQLRALEVYYKALEKYDRPTLEQAWERVRDNHKLVIWPPPQQFVDAAKLSRTCPSPPSEEEQKFERAIEMKEAKSREYRKTSNLYKQAKREGWAGPLGTFIDAELWIQAQILAGCKGISFTGHLARLVQPDKEYASSKEAVQAIREWMGNRFCEEGKLIVKPPSRSLINQWQEEAKTKSNGPLAQTFKEVIERQKQKASSSEVGGRC